MRIGSEPQSDAQHADREKERIGFRFCDRQLNQRKNQKRPAHDQVFVHSQTEPLVERARAEID